jgi:hypothetical protein
VGRIVRVLRNPRDVRVSYTSHLIIINFAPIRHSSTYFSTGTDANDAIGIEIDSIAGIDLINVLNMCLDDCRNEKAESEKKDWSHNHSILIIVLKDCPYVRLRRIDNLVDLAHNFVNNWVIRFVTTRIPSVTSALKKVPYTF